MDAGSSKQVAQRQVSDSLITNVYLRKGQPDNSIGFCPSYVINSAEFRC